MAQLVESLQENDWPEESDVQAWSSIILQPDARLRRCWKGLKKLKIMLKRWVAFWKWRRL